MRFFIDNNLSKNLALGMRGFGENVIHLLEEFPGSADDAEWLKVIGSKGWVLVTRDERIRYRPAEINAIKTHKVGTFFLGGKNRTRCQLIQQLVRHWPRMKELSQKTRPPYAFRIPPRGTKITPLEL